MVPSAVMQGMIHVKEVQRGTNSASLAEACEEKRQTITQ